MGELPSAAEAARAIAASRDRLVGFALARTEQEWAAPVLAAAGDERPLGVVVDHVGHAYEYLVGFIGAIVELVGSLSAEDLALDGGRVARLAAIAARHADDHRVDLEKAPESAG